jgi:hypothetical protein
MVRGGRRARRDAGTEPEPLGRLALPAFIVGQAVRPAEHGPELTAIAALFTDGEGVVVAAGPSQGIPAGSRCDHQAMP